MRLPRPLRRLLRAAVAWAREGGWAMARAGKRRVIRQSAAVPYRWRDGRLEVLLITSRGSGEWIVPKGLVEPDLTEHDSAAKEAREEAGVVGRVGDAPVGSFEYEKWGGLCVVRVFDLAVGQELSDWPEKGQRKRKWVDAREAAGLVKHRSLGDIIAALPERLAGPGGGRSESD